MAKGESRRSIRMADMIMREMGNMLIEEVQDPRLSMVTISGARLNSDLRVATVLFTVPGGEEAVAAAMAGLTKAAGFLRRGLGKRMEFRFLPELRFQHDTFLEDMVYGPGTGNDLPHH